MSRTKKTRKPGKMTVFLPTGPSKTELLADPSSRESRRKLAQAKKRHQQRSQKRSEGTENSTPTSTVKQRQPRLKQSPDKVAAASQQLLQADAQAARDDAEE